MVEAEEFCAKDEKTFVEDTAILDKLKAAAAITDGKYHSKYSIIACLSRLANSR